MGKGDINPFVWLFLQEILTSIEEQDAKFSKREYSDLLSLHARSQAVRDNSAHEQRMERLKKIFDNKLKMEE